ncbi:MAG: hypothetical protein IJ689_02645 [Alphaproteobacteria bacterium]|nr:hypothetical protein [Alphaproteobacteria bacterium]
MNKYVLVIGSVILSYGASVCFAENSDTMSVSATIAHDANVAVNTHMKFVFTIDPSISSGTIKSSDGSSSAGILEANKSVTRGVFTAYVPGVSLTEKLSFSPSSVASTRDPNVTIGSLDISYKSGNQFYLDGTLTYSAVPLRGEHTFAPITITYNP